MYICIYLYAYRHIYVCVNFRFSHLIAYTLCQLSNFFFFRFGLSAPNPFFSHPLWDFEAGTGNISQLTQCCLSVEGAAEGRSLLPFPGSSRRPREFQEDPRRLPCEFCWSQLIICCHQPRHVSTSVNCVVNVSPSSPPV